MSYKEFKDQMLMSERVYFTDPEAAINNCHRLMAQLLVDLGYSEGIQVYKRIMIEESKHK